MINIPPQFKGKSYAIFRTYGALVPMITKVQFSNVDDLPELIQETQDEFSSNRQMMKLNQVNLTMVMWSSNYYGDDGLCEYKICESYAPHCWMTVEFVTEPDIMAWGDMMAEAHIEQLKDGYIESRYGEQDYGDEF